MKSKYLNAGLKDVGTEDLLDRVDFLESQTWGVRNCYDHMYRDWCNEIAFRLYGN